ncbi:IclR family transcriptional regulator [Paenarthrobacter nitroguajacolicus]|uniref:IclR family transcriptional regulator n=1 Tax=Paenarthrobacter nitroguajacolicus TaxID=211146 RepID=UPI000AACCDD1|nr:helix-turn-helix domain-containing protein [Paenarthrobacter nitroguajacolicus]
MAENLQDSSKTAAKLLDILEALDHGAPESPQLLARRLGMNRTVTQRLLTTLLTRGFVRREAGQYALAFSIRELSNRVLPELRKAAEIEVKVLSENVSETVVFQIPDGETVVVLAEAVSPRPMSVLVRHRVGSKSPMTRSASGIALLAADPASIRPILDASEDGADILHRVEEARKSGFAYSEGILQEGVSGMALAVRGAGGSVVGSLAILVPAARSHDLAEHLGHLRRSAKTIGRSLS